jgi:hypothetical protein
MFDRMPWKLLAAAMVAGLLVSGAPAMAQTIEATIGMDMSYVGDEAGRSKDIEALHLILLSADPGKTTTDVSWMLAAAQGSVSPLFGLATPSGAYPWESSDVNGLYIDNTQTLRSDGYFFYLLREDPQVVLTLPNSYSKIAPIGYGRPRRR